jgi:tetratricopeptide (TPR) repeat protein
MTAIPKEIEDRWRIIKENLIKADNEFQVELRECWEQRGTTEEQDLLQREKSDIEFRIKNAAGYSLFRWAEYWADLKQIPRFKELCEEAIEKLEEANVARPNHYEVLQNMAMIYEDNRYDPEGAYLDKAQSLYLQTVGFVPNDYFQYEHLAEIEWRRIEGLPANADLIRKGKQYALTAVKLRPHASAALRAVARFNVKIWENSKDKASTETKAAVAEALEFFKRAIAARPKSAEFLAEYAKFLVQVADTKTTDANAAVESGSALLELARREAIEPEPKKLLLDRAVQMFAKALDLTKEKDPEEKKELNARAQTLHDEAEQLRKTLK